MKKTIAILVSAICLSMLASVSAQSNSPNPAMVAPNLAGSIFAVVVLGVVFFVIIYGGYKILRKWIRTESD